MTTTILCEKYSQAQAIAAGLALGGMNGSYKGTSYMLTWAAGHLLEYETPDESKPDANWRDPASLLPLPLQPKLVPSPKSSKAIKRVKDCLKHADSVILATDPDREGEAIGRNLLAHCKYKGPMKRLWLTGGMDAGSIRKAFGNMRSDADSQGLMCAQEARSTADYLYMFVTRGYTALGRRGGLGDKLGQGKGRASVVSVGRVQTPTLRLIVERDRAINSFKPVTHYKPIIEIEQDGQAAFLHYAPALTEQMREQKWEGVTWQPRDKGPDKPLFTNKQAVDDFCERISALQQVGLNVASKPGKKPAPMCYALIDLQRAANAQLKLSAAKTLEIAQSLYTEGYISYPRTEHRELPKSAYPDAPAILDALADDGLSPGAKAAGLHRGPDAQVPRAYRNKEMEHHGLMPTQKTPGSRIKSQARAVYDLVAKRYIESHLPDAITEIMAVQANNSTPGLFGEDPARFANKSERIVEPGWMAAFPSSSQNQDTPLPKLETGQAAINAVTTEQGKTKPPAAFTENTLLGAMKNAARFLDGDEASTLRSANGLGTPATRASIIETLLVRDYITREKDGKLRGTQSGFDLIDNTPSELSDIAMTAQWEAILSDIETLPGADARDERDAFITDQSDHLTALIEAICDDIGECVPFSDSGGNGPSDKMKKLAANICNKLGLNAPEGLATDFDTCKEFIGQHIDAYKKVAGSGGPSAKMVNFAKILSERNSVALPDGFDTDFATCKAFINQHAE